MNDKMIIFWIVVIIGSSMLVGKLFELIPKFIKFIIEKGVPLLLIISIVRNVFFVKEILPKLKGLAQDANIQGIVHRLVFYIYTAITMLGHYITQLIRSI